MIKKFITTKLISRLLLLTVLGISLLFATNATANPWPKQQQANATVIDISNDVQLFSAKRMGINIGSYDQYGSAQYLKNIIPNPGFEAGEFAMIFLVGPNPSRGRVQPNRWLPPWDAQQPGFWDSATYEVLSGPAKGRSGTIRRFAREGNNYTFYLNGGGAAPEVDNAILVRRSVPGYFPDQFSRFAFPDPNQKRPGSLGDQSLRLVPSDYVPSLSLGFDSFGRDADRTAGKMRIVDGAWEIEFWAKAQRPNTTLEVKFHRPLENVFFIEEVPLTTNWQKIKRRFTVPVGLDDPDKITALAFEMRIGQINGQVLKDADNGNSVWVDDLYLAQGDDFNPTAFSQEFVNILRELNPGVLRNWGNQHGSSLENQLANQYARKTTEHHPYQADPKKWHYSLHDFLTLAEEVDAEPWYVIPPSFSGHEMQNLVAYLSAPVSHPFGRLRADQGHPEPWTDVFNKIHLEYGNEMWGPNSHGDPFLGATLRGGAHVAEVAGDRFAIMRRSPHFVDHKMNLIVGGQAGNPWQQGQIELNSSSHDSVGLAPYFGDLTRYGNDTQSFYPLYASPIQQTTPGSHGKMLETKKFVDEAGQGTELAIYEINSHYTYGWTPIEIRNNWLTSQGMGIALPLHMLTYQRDLGVNTQTAFTALQYSFLMPRKWDQRARLWGMLRDIGATQRKRPTWLGVELANKAIQGDLITTAQSGRNPSYNQEAINGIVAPLEVPFIQSFAYRDGDKYSVVLFNLNLYATERVTLRLPEAPSGSATLHSLWTPNVYADNEDAENVVITSERRNIAQSMTLDLKPHGMYVLEWETR